MPKTFIIAATTAVAAADFGAIIDHVNTNNSTWVAGPVDRSVEDFKAMCGTWLPGHPQYIEQDLPAYPEDLTATFDDSLDWRTKAPGCTVISKIRDQSACGSCWAFGSTETFEDRHCVQTQKDIEFSAMDTAGCCKGLFCGMSMGCNGGQPTAALKWMSSTGVVTGGDFYDIGNNTSCKPYSLQPCAHHVPATAKYPVCPQAEYSVKCDKSCSESGYTTSYSDDKTKGGTASSVNSVNAMMTALQKGPLSVAFTVYSDFPTYKSGVYKHTTGSALGGHAVEIIGYGNDPTGGDYWVVKNSWNEEWGNGGTFNIARGTNECGIEGQVAAIDF
jgi:cathepsin B